MPDQTDLPRAAALFQQAAATGFARAQFKYAEMVERGLGGLAQSFTDADRLYHLAAEQEDPGARQRLGLSLTRADSRDMSLGSEDAAAMEALGQPRPGRRRARSSGAYHQRQGARAVVAFVVVALWQRWRGAKVVFDETGGWLLWALVSGDF